MIRSAPLAAGVAVLFTAWVVLPALELPPFAGHMTMHMAVVAVAAPLLAMGIAGGALDPSARWPSWLSPIPASLVELVGVWSWHTPWLHHAARHRVEALFAEQATFLGAGLLLWLAVLGGSADERRGRAVANVTAMLLTSMHLTLLGALLVLTPRALFPHAHAGPTWLTATQDQHVGGAVMVLFGGAVYLGAGLALTAEVLRRPGTAA